MSHLRGSCDHVLDEITMSWGINDGDVILGSLELPQGDINGDTSFTLSLQLVQNPGVLEGTLTHLNKQNTLSRYYYRYTKQFNTATQTTNARGINGYLVKCDHVNLKLNYKKMSSFRDTLCPKGKC